MATRCVIALSVLLALHEALLPGMLLPAALVSLALVILGLLYAHMAVNAEDATGYLALTIAVGAVAGMDVLGNIPAIGGHLDSIIDPISVVLYSGVVTVLVKRAASRITG